MRSSAELIAALRGRGWKVTPQRIAVFEALHSGACGSHPTAEVVHEVAAARIGAISIRSVYQTLHELASLGEVQAVHVLPGATRFDVNVDRHDHLVCDVCGAITDVVLDPPVMGADALAGFRVGGTDVVVHGVCARCGSAP